MVGKRMVRTSCMYAKDLGYWRVWRRFGDNDPLVPCHCRRNVLMSFQMEISEFDDAVFMLLN
jgi:hypothetical protein